MKFKSKSLEIGRIKVKLSPKEPILGSFKKEKLHNISSNRFWSGFWFLKELSRLSLELFVQWKTL
jgi:hypothetical protein